MWQTVWDIDSTSSYQRSLGQQFLKGHDQFMTILVDSDKGSIQIRETLSGEIVDSIQVNNIYEENKFELLPDSNRFIMSVGGVRNILAGFEIRNIDDYSIINKFEVPLDGERTNENGNTYNNRIIEIKTDPVRPYVYFILEKGINGKQSETDKDYYSIKVYNYEIGEEVKELRAYKDVYMYLIDISHDGKYLASLNEGESYLNVWELNTFNQIRSYELDKDNSDNSWRENVEDLKFSTFNSDIIYFSGSFSRIGNPNEFENGVFEFSIEKGNHFNRLPNNGYSGKLLFAEDERILVINSSFYLSFFDFYNDRLELLTSQPEGFLIGTNAIYSFEYKSFISSISHRLNSFQYITETKVNDTGEFGREIYPNPTTSLLNIDVDCNDTEINLTIMDTQGSILNQITKPINSNSISINISNYPTGIYLIQFLCNEQLVRLKVIKEG